jgi:hypothetical protein
MKYFIASLVSKFKFNAVKFNILKNYKLKINPENLHILNDICRKYGKKYNISELALAYITSICKMQEPPYSDAYIETVRRYNKIASTAINNNSIKAEVGVNFTCYANKLLDSVSSLPDEIKLMGRTFEAAVSYDGLMKELNSTIKPYYSCMIKFDLSNEDIAACVGYLYGVARAAEFCIYGKVDDNKLAQSIFLKLIDDNLSSEIKGVLDFIVSFDLNLSEDANPIETLDKLPIFNMFNKLGFVDGITFLNKQLKIRFGLSKLADFFDAKHPGRVLSRRLLHELGS